MLGTFLLYRNLARPMRPIRAWTSNALSAFRRPSWSFKTCFIGGGSSGTTSFLPGSTLGHTIWPSLLFSTCHLFYQSLRTSFFSRQSHWSIGTPVHSSIQSFRFAPGVLASCLLASCVPAGPRRFVRRRILVWIVLHASRIFCAIPECSSLAWKRATRPLSHRSSGGTYDSASSWRTGVALNAPSTVWRPWFWCFCTLATMPLGLPVVGWCHSAAPYDSPDLTTAW